MFLKKTPKSKGTYLAITESYYDKEKKATRQKTIMGLGYLEDLKKDYPDPISHFEKVVADMNQEREAKKNSVVYVDLTTALSPGEHSLKNVGYGILKYLYKELQLDIFWRTRTWNLSLPYNIEELFHLPEDVLLHTSQGHIQLLHYLFQHRDPAILQDHHSPER